MTSEDEARIRQGAAVDRTVGAIGGGLLSALGGVVYGPDGAQVGQALATSAAPWIEEISFYARTAFKRRTAKASRAVEVAAQIAELEPPGLIQKVLGDEQLTELATRVIEASAASTFDEKVRALGEALGRAVTYQDQAKVDVELLFVEAVSRLEVSHLRLMMVLENKATHEEDLGVVSASGPEAVERYQRAWSEELIEQADPGLLGVSHILTARLTSLGLVEQPAGDSLLPRSPILLTRFGQLCLSRLRGQETTEA